MLNSIDQIEIKPNLHCNLNCPKCWEGAYLYDESSIYPLSKFEKDINILSTFYDVIFNFNVMGGEPLVNNNIMEYIKIIKNCNIKSQYITVLTNGILLDKYIDELLSEPKMTIRISDYGLSYVDYDYFRKYDKRIEFHNNPQYNIEVNSPINRTKSCPFYGDCLILYNSRIYACWRSICIQDIQKNKFDNNIPPAWINDSLDINNLHKWWQLWAYRKNITPPLEACKWCNIEKVFNDGLTKRA